jgi:hypothetical protein
MLTQNRFVLFKVCTHAKIIVVIFGIGGAKIVL